MQPFIISIQGCHAVGKSTLLQKLKAVRPNYHYCEEGVEQLELRKSVSKLRPADIEEDFYEIQTWYIKLEVERFAKFANADIVIIDRGPEEKEFYTLHYCIVNQKDWDVENNFKGAISTIRNLRSDRILYLDATLETVLLRRSQDIRNRPTMDVWLKYWHSSCERFLKGLPYTKTLPTDLMSSANVLEWTLDWIDKKCPL